MTAPAPRNHPAEDAHPAHIAELLGSAYNERPDFRLDEAPDAEHWLRAAEKVLAEGRLLEGLEPMSTDRTPAPMAVADIEAMPIRERDDLVSAVLRFMTDRGYRVTMPPRNLPIMDARPEPVVAPLPSEAVDGLADVIRRHDVSDHRIVGAAAVRETCAGCGHSEVVSLADPADQWLARHQAQEVLTHLRLVPEDDEDTVRVPRSVLDRAAAAINVAVAHAEGRVHASDGNRAEELAGCRIARDDLQLLIDGATR